MALPVAAIIIHRWVILFGQGRGLWRAGGQAKIAPSAILACYGEKENGKPLKSTTARNKRNAH